VDKKLTELSLGEKEEHSREVIRETLRRFGDDVGVAFSGGKDSTTLLHLIQSVFEGKMPWKVFTLDTGFEFQKIKEFIGKIARDWNIEVIELRNNEVVHMEEPSHDRGECCYLRKVLPINAAISAYNLRALMTAVRWDEQAERTDEQFFADKEAPPHSRVQPLLHFTEFDIWSYIRKYSLPYCDLYKKGYRSIDCEPCTRPFGGDGAERGGRNPDKEKVMKRLREAGYF
jgi:phosphoadenosine phosphosulfate reductase